MTTKVRVNVKRKMDGAKVIHDKVKKLITLAGVELHEIMYDESLIRPDGKGGAQGAKDTGQGSGSIVILKKTDTKVIVGTPLKYMADLARGRPQPMASLEFIEKWVKRKDVPIPPKRVWMKIKTKGPIPNPFDKRTADKFIRRFPSILSEVK